MALRGIQTIIFCMLENRSFDHMLGYLSLEGTLAVEGLRADPVWQAGWINTGNGNPYRLNRLQATDRIDDPPHGSVRIKQQMETPAQAHPNMGGFVQAYLDSREPDASARKKPLSNPPDRVMGYYTSSAVPTFDFFARNYCVCDHWFTPLPLGTQANRLMAMAGESKVADNEFGLPYQPLVYDWLKRNRIKWRVYQSGDFFPFFALMDRWAFHIVGEVFQKKGNFTRFHRFADDWKNAASMPPVIFVEPEYSDGPRKAPNDDHPPTMVGGGQALLRELYEALIGNEERWARTLLIITYDEHGGFFDHVSPLRVRGKAGGEVFETTGPRVPAFLVSPMVEPGSVYSENLDHTSFLALLAERFTPGHGYSAAVNERQGQLTGRISATLLDKPRAGPPPRMSQAPTSAAPLSAAASSSLAPRAPDTPNAVAFDRLARRVQRERPGLLGHGDLAGVREYLAKAPPAALRTDHIEDV